MPARSASFFPLSIFCIGFSFGFQPIWSFDLWWQMAEARWILERAAYPIADHFTYTLQGTPYIAHEWGTDMAFYFLYSIGGAHALLLFQALAFGAFGLMFYALLKKRSSDPWPAWLMALLFMLIVKMRFPLRPELFSHFFMLALWFLHDSRKPWIPYGYAALFGLWSNFHGEFVFGLGFVFLCFATAPSWENAKRLAASGIGVFINPYGWNILSVPWFYLHNQELIFRASTEGQFVLQHFCVALGLTASTLALIYWNRRGRGKTSIPFQELALVLAFGAQTMKINRIFVLCAVVIMPILYAELLKRIGPKLKARGRNDRRKALAWAAVLLCVAPRAGRAAQIWRNPMDQRSLPVRAVDFLETIGARGNVFNSYSFGGYLAWRMYPRIKTFYDGRFNCTPLLHEESRARETPDGWKAFIKKRDARFAVIDWVWEGGLNRLLGPAWKQAWAAESFNASPYKWLLPESDWTLIYWDERALVFARNTAENHDIVDRYKLRFGGPLSWEKTLQHVLSGRIPKADALAELDALRRRSGDNWIQTLLRGKLGLDN